MANIGLGSKRWRMALMALVCVVAGAVLLSYLEDNLSGVDSMSSGSGELRAATRRDDAGMPMSGDAMTMAARSSNHPAGFAPAAIYDPGRQLGEQLPELKRHAEAGNAYAICVLAMALDSCMQEMTQSDQSRWDELATDDVIEEGGENEVRRLTAEIESRKVRAFMCGDVSDFERRERDKWMQLSAKNGDPRAMALYARNPVFTANVRLADIDRLVDYNKNAEAMLNRAAMAGVPEAIEGVYMAYLHGEIETPVGEVSVEKDHAKAVGAAMAMLEFAREADKADIQKNIDGMIGGMGDAERARMTSMRKAYARAYRAQAADGDSGLSPVARPPDSTCLSMRGRPKAVVASVRD